MNPLATRYLGLELRNPLVASASPLTGEVGSIRALEDNGAAAVVLPSLFEEQVEAEEERFERIARIGATAEAESLFPATGGSTAADRTLALLQAARAAVDIPIIASLNGTSIGGWTSYARDLEQAGAAAIELNIYFIPADAHLSGADVEAQYRAVLTAVKNSVLIPVVVKLSPFFSAPGAVIRQLEAYGADGFALFNRFYQPDIDLASLRLQRDLTLSTPAEIRLPLLWIGLLAGRINASLAATTGVETEAEVLKYLLAGADAVMTTSALLRHGPAHVRRILDGLHTWIEARGVTVGSIRGRMSHARLDDPSAFERANYIRILQGWHG